MDFPTLLLKKNSFRFNSSYIFSSDNHINEISKMFQLKRELRLKKRHNEATKKYLQISQKIEAMVSYFRKNLQKYDSSICHPEENSPFHIGLKLFDPFGCKYYGYLFYTVFMFVYLI